MTDRINYAVDDAEQHHQKKRKGRKKKEEGQTTRERLKSKATGSSGVKQLEYHVHDLMVSLAMKKKRAQYQRLNPSRAVTLEHMKTRYTQSSDPCPCSGRLVRKGWCDQPNCCVMRFMTHGEYTSDLGKVRTKYGAVIQQLYDDRGIDPDEDFSDDGDDDDDTKS